MVLYPPIIWFFRFPKHIVPVFPRSVTIRIGGVERTCCEFDCRRLVLLVDCKSEEQARELVERVRHWRG